MAEREGFEPSIRLTVYTLSRRAPSATRTPLQIKLYLSNECTTRTMFKLRRKVTSERKTMQFAQILIGI